MKRLTAEENETLSTIMGEYDSTMWLMYRASREARRHKEFYEREVLPQAQAALGPRKTAPHGTEAILAELESTRMEIAQYKALAGETDGNRTQAQHHNVGKTILTALYLMELLSSYAYSFGLHVGHAFNTEFGKLMDKNNPQFAELEASDPQLQAIQALYSGTFGGQSSTTMGHGGDLAVDPSNSSGPVPGEPEGDGFLFEIPTPALGSPTINQQTTRLLSRSQIEDFIRSPGTAVTKTFATIRRGGGENLSVRVKDVFKVQGVIGWSSGLTVYIVHRGSDDKCAYGYAVEEFRDFLNPALEENLSVYEVAGN